MFDNDIFISYAIIDNQPLNPGEEGWISNVHRMLEIRLSQLLGAKPKVWRDEKLTGNDLLTPILQETVVKSAIMVSILSPRYIQSEWCKMEVKEFFNNGQALQNLSVNHRNRIFKVIKTKVPVSAHPPEMQDMLGYEFFIEDQASGRPREFNKVFGPEFERMFWAKLDDLAHDIANTLEKLRNSGLVASVNQVHSFGPAAQTNGSTATAPASAAAGTGKKIFLAEAPGDTREARETLLRELKGRGFTVLPDHPLPLTGPELEADLKEQLAACELSIHLFHSAYGLVPEEAEKSMSEIQNTVAAQFSKEKGLKRLLWIHPDSAPTDARQQQFLKRIREDGEWQHAAELFETPLEVFKTAVVTAVTEKEKPKAPPPASPVASSGPKRIYLICDAADLDHTRALEDYLFDAGHEVVLPVFEGDEAAVREDHQENLRLCDGVIIYYGAGNELWLRAKLRELQKAPGYGREAPLNAKAIVIGEPASPVKDRFRTHEALVVKSSTDLAASLQSFMEALT